MASSAEGTFRHVLCVAYFFPPSGGAGVQRPLKFIKYLPDHAWRCHVLTVEDGSFFADDATLLSDIPPQTDVIRTPSWEFERMPGLRARRREHSAGKDLSMSPAMRFLRAARTWVLPDPQIGWLPHAVRAASRLIAKQRIDAIWTTSTPFTSHLIGMQLAQRFNIPWVADFRDPWSADPFGLLAHHPVHAYLERKVIERANRVVGVNDGITKFLQARDRKASVDKYHVIPNGYDAQDFAAAADVKPFDDGMWHITMTGSVYAKVDIVPFLEGLARFVAKTPEARGKVRVHWVGQMDRPTHANYRATVQRLYLENVCERVGYVAHVDSVRWLMRSHLLLLPMFAGADAVHWMPGKMFEYLASKTPILLCAGDGIARDLIGEAGAGEVVHPDDVQGIVAALQNFWQAHCSGAPAPTPNPTVVARFERRVLTAQLANILDGL